MNTTGTMTGIPPNLAAEFQEALDDLAEGIPRPEKMQAACDRMDRLREEKLKCATFESSGYTLIRTNR